MRTLANTGEKEEDLAARLKSRKPLPISLYTEHSFVNTYE